MNRQQLEECAWQKTPKDERRATKEHYDWKTQKTSATRLKGNEREVRVFNPSGDTEGTMSPWMPLWALFSDELEQRCKQGSEPKMRAPYNRMRGDYTGNVESSPVRPRSQHAMKKTKSSAPCIDVVFRVFPEGDVIAFFPGDTTRAGLVNSYQHVGQHGEASRSLIRELRAATPKEYKPLLAELKQVGYCLRVRSK